MLCVLVRCVCILGIILVYCLSLCDAHSMFTRKKDELGQRQGSLGRKLAAGPWYWSVRKSKKTNLNARDPSDLNTRSGTLA